MLHFPSSASSTSQCCASMRLGHTSMHQLQLQSQHELRWRNTGSRLSPPAPPALGGGHGHAAGLPPALAGGCAEIGLKTQ